MPMTKINNPGFRKAVWLLAVSETIHNLEEAIRLPLWSATAGVWHPPVEPFQFRFAVAVVTLVFVAVIAWYSKKGATYGKYLMGGSLIVILFNVFIPHLGASLFLMSYTPGVLSALLLNLPLSVWLLRRGLREREFSPRSLVAGTIMMAMILLPVMAASFALGAKIGLLL